ncbi:ATP-binding SpoIIE family protein phosphatase [Symbiobacterium terraclitae]|uniref:ATP-binding SpoIIE family protein phosphatase n=1 Tax=Symbiobacterium terraclitae TaxID=557451 RepID=UPI0035B556E5
MLFLGLMATGVGWIYLQNYIRLGRTPSDYPLPVTLTMLLGALALGLVLDGLAGYRLRAFLRALERRRGGEPLQPGEAEASALAAIRFPEQAALLLLGSSAVMILLHRFVSYRGELTAMLLSPVVRANLLTSMLRDFILALLLALLLFTFARRALRPAIAEFHLRVVPAESRFPVGLRLALVVLVMGVFNVSQFASAPQAVAGVRLAWIYLPPVVLTAVVAYLIATDIGRDLRALAGRLRALSEGVRPALFDRFAVTGRDEVGDLTAALNRLQDRVEREFREVERDMATARSIQMGMLPRSWRLPPGWQLEAALHPAREVGGDFYDVIDLGDGRFGIAVGDAVGKGLPAALLMASAVSLLRSHAPLHDGPGATLAAVNRLICGHLPPTAFITCAYAVVDTRRREVCWASAGHLPPFAGRLELPALPALPLGVEPEAEFPEQVWHLRPGVPLLLYTDGLIEGSAFPGGVRPAGWTDVLQNPDEPAGVLVERLVAPLLPQAEQGSLEDDVTALVLVPPAELHLALPSRQGVELEAAARAAEFARRYGPAGRADDVATAVGEACLNAISHGNRLRAETAVRVRLAAGPAWLEAVIEDEGEPFALPASPPDLAAQMAGDGPVRGWGLHLISAVADEVRVEPLEGGKQVRMRFGGDEAV